MRDASGDPFAALDGAKAKPGNNDELSNRFPTLDQFSILHEKGDKFEFEPTVSEAKPTDAGLSRRITHALADEVFARNTPGSAPNETRGEAESADKKTYPFPEMKSESTSQSTTIHQPVPQKPAMVSTGTMTSPSPPSENPPLPQRPIYRFPPQENQRRPSNPTRASESNDKLPSSNQGINPSQTANLLKTESPKPTPLSSRPSLEVSRPPTLEVEGAGVRSKSANAKTRPASAIVGSKSEYARDRGRDSSRSPLDPSWAGEKQEDGERVRPSLADSNRDSERGNIYSDVDFLRAKEEEEMGRKREKRVSGGAKHGKRSSLSSISLSGTKTLLAGRFGDAFRRFEENPEEKNSLNTSNDHLTPITGSEVTELSDDERALNDTDDISPEMRREFERRRQSKEEKRVANAAAEYRMRLSEKGEPARRGGGGDGMASGIQNKVQSLLGEENSKPQLPSRTASGYGHVTDSGSALQAKQFEKSPTRRFSVTPSISRKSVTSDGLDVGPKPPPKDIKDLPKKPQPSSSTHPPTARANQRPVAPPKPKSLQTGEHSDPTRNMQRSDNTQSSHDNPTGQKEDWENNFNRRYPSLSGLEMVETEIDIPRHLPTLRTKEV